MSVFKALLSFLRKKGTPEQETSPEGLCPNCWGREEYGGQFFQAVRNQGLDVNSKDPDVGWVKEYASKHLSGIQLIKENNSIACAKCKITYRQL